MRTLAATAVVLGVLAVARPAHAQFQNHSIGLDVGGVYTQPNMGFKMGPSLALDATLYIESGFDIGLRFGFSIQQDRISKSQQVLIYPAFEMHYYLVQDYFRPYVGANLEFMHAFDSNDQLDSANYVGIGPTLGFDYFVSEDWSVGLGAEYAGYFALNAGVHYSIQFWGRVATHF